MESPATSATNSKRSNLTLKPQSTPSATSSSPKNGKQKSSQKFVSCAVITCRKNSRRNPGLLFAKFPSNEQKCWEWVKRVGDPDLVHVPIEKLCTLRYVCSEHFPPADFTTSPKVKISAHAVPTIFKPSMVSLTDEQMKDFVGYVRPRPPKQACREKYLPSHKTSPGNPYNRKDSYIAVVVANQPDSDAESESEGSPRPHPIQNESEPNQHSQSLTSTVPPHLSEFHGYAKPFSERGKTASSDNGKNSDTQKQEEELMIEILVCESSEDEESDTDGEGPTDDGVQDTLESKESKPSTVVSDASVAKSRVPMIPAVPRKPLMVDRGMLAKVSPMRGDFPHKNKKPRIHDTAVQCTIEEGLSNSERHKRVITNSSCQTAETLDTSPSKGQIKPVTFSPMLVHALRLTPGTDVVSYLKDFVSFNSLKAAFIVTCVGSVSRVDLRYATNTDGKHLHSEIQNNLEICSLVGTVSKDGCHLHGTFGRSDGETVSGHIMGNMIVQTTAELVLGQAVGLEFSRLFDNSTGFRELVVEREQERPT